MSSNEDLIINPHFKVITWYPTAIIACKCQEKGLTIIITTGIGNFVKCNHCGKMYCIDSVGPEGCQMSMFVPAPGGSVQ